MKPRRQRVFPADRLAEEEIALIEEDLTAAEIDAIEAELRSIGMPEWWIRGELTPVASQDPDWDKTNHQLH